MNADVSHEKIGDLPVYALGFFCILFLIFFNARLTFPKKSPLETASHSTGWKFEKPNLCVLLLKTAIMFSSPLIYLLSTFLLFIGTVKKNLYLSLPWLGFAFKGIFVIQSLHLLDLFQSILDTGMGESGWRSYFLYIVVVAFDMAKCFFLQEIVKMFQELWAMSLPKDEEEKIENLNGGVSEVMETDNDAASMGS